MAGNGRHRAVRLIATITFHHGGSMPEQTLQDLYISELKDLYSSEQQLVKALPKIAKNVESQELSDAISSHLEETKNHVTRLEQIFSSLDENPKGKKCVGMQGILEEGEETMDEFEGSVLDAGVISAAQRVEHYEIAAYGAVCTYAELLERTEDLGLLKETLQEEKNADEKLTELSESINQSALEGIEEGEEEVMPERRQVGREKTGRNRKTRSAA
jgi:ferritin-like metal-binding protein YciE